MTSILKVSTIQDPTNSNTAFTIGADGRAYPKAGGIVQVQHTQFTGQNSYSVTANAWSDISDLAVNITPASTSSVIMVQLFIGGWEHSATDDHVVRFAFYRDATLLVAPNAGSRWAAIGMGATNYYDTDRASTPAVAWLTYFDTPSTTSQITYKGAVNAGATGSFVVNRSVTDGDSAGYERTVSSIIATEIAG